MFAFKQEKEIKSLDICFWLVAPPPPPPIESERTFCNPRDEIFADGEIQKYSRDEVFAGDKKSYETFRGYAEKPRYPRKFIPAKIYASKVSYLI